MPRPLNAPTIAHAVLPELGAKLAEVQAESTVPEGAQSAPAFGPSKSYLAQILQAAVPLVLGQLEAAYGDELKALVAKARSGVHLVLTDRDIEFLEEVLATLKTGE
jgi:hypothetical protein